MVGMRRPKKCKAPRWSRQRSTSREVDYDTSTTGDQHLTLDGASSAAPQTHVLSAAAQSKLDAATDVFLEAEVKADALKQIATEYDKKEKLNAALA